MKAHILQHVPFEGPGSIASWLAERSVDFGTTRLFASDPLPEQDDFDLLIAMGGPMSVNDEADWPWLAKEKRFIADAVARGKAVLGICLGAQLIASAMGAKVYPGAQREIGWFDISATTDDPGLFRFPATETVFHWHGETFDLPSGAARLARSVACENQAFQVGGRVIGLQFHLETTRASADSIIVHCRHELVPAPFVQNEAQIRAALPDNYARINARMGEVLDFITRDFC